MPEGAGISAQRLKSYIQRIERLEEEKRALRADIREVYSEAQVRRLRCQNHASGCEGPEDRQIGARGTGIACFRTICEAVGE